MRCCMDDQIARLQAHSRFFHGKEEFAWVARFRFLVMTRNNGSLVRLLELILLSLLLLALGQQVEMQIGLIGRKPMFSARELACLKKVIGEISHTERTRRSRVT